jgi:hypothetical protein
VTVLRAWHPLRAVAPFKMDLDWPPDTGLNGPSRTPHFPVDKADGIRCWALPGSLAATEGILVSFFSTA